MPCNVCGRLLGEFKNYLFHNLSPEQKKDYESLEEPIQKFEFQADLPSQRPDLLRVEYDEVSELPTSVQLTTKAVSPKEAIEGWDWRPIVVVFALPGP